MFQLDQQRATELLRYEPETGLLFWRVQRGRQATGSTAGSLDAHGYVLVSIDGVLLKAHRVIWLMQTGHWPKQTIDHINGKRSDNRWSNLRDVSQSSNMLNLRGATRANRTSGLLGVNWNRRIGKWHAQLMVEGTRHHLGYFADSADASAAYWAAKNRMTSTERGSDVQS